MPSSRIQIEERPGATRCYDVMRDGDQIGVIYFCKIDGEWSGSLNDGLMVVRGNDREYVKSEILKAAAKMSVDDGVE